MTRPVKKSILVFAVLILMVLGIIGTHNNLLYIVLVLFLVCTVLGWAGPAVFSRSLRVQRSAPASGYAGNDISMEVQVRNRGRFFKTPDTVISHLNSLPGSGHVPVRVESLAPGSEVRFRLPVHLAERGIHRFNPAGMITAFPMGLFEREWRVQDSAEILIYPRIVSVRDRLLEGAAVNLSRPSAVPDTSREVQSFRYYREGDDMNRVNWKATARRDELVVGEYNRVEKKARVALYLDISGGTRARREAAISMAASLAVFYHARKRLIKLVTARDVITFGRSERKMKAMLRLLALLGPEDERALRARGSENGSCLTVLIHSGKKAALPRRADLVIGPHRFAQFAPALARRRADVT